MSDNKNNNPPERRQLDITDSNIALSTETSQRMSSTSERQIKFERAQRCLENAALVSKRIKEHRKATAELLGRPFEEDDGDTASELASTMSEKTGYSAATDTSTTLSVQDALNIPGISESLANTLKQKELLMERIKQYKEISKRPMTKPSVQTVRRESAIDTKIEQKKIEDKVDVTQLLHTIKEKDNSLNVIQGKMKAMETTILDLQEKLNEKDQIIEAKNKAITLMSDSLSKKEKDSLILLEDTRQQMTKMQENFIAMESEWKEEKLQLLKEIEVRDEKISSLEEAYSILESSRFEISASHSKLSEELEAKNVEILKLEEKIESLLQKSKEEASLKEKDDVEEEKGSLEIAGMAELTKKIELLEQLNCQIRQTNKELENKLANVNTENKTQSASAAGKKGSPLPVRKGRNTALKSKSPWSQLSSESLPQETDKKAAKSEIARLEMLVQSLNKDILEKEYVISQKETLIKELKTASFTTESKDTIEIGVCTDFVEDSKNLQHTHAKNQESDLESSPFDETQSEIVKDLHEKLNAAEEQIETLRKDIEAANLNMIKVKSAHKSKVKELQKTIDGFGKVSDSNAEMLKTHELQNELQQLTRKVAVLEEEKGNLQLDLVDYASNRLTESDMCIKLKESESLAETRLKAISVLEAQKFDLVQELHVLQQKNMDMEDKLADISQLQSEHVCTEMKSVQMEEQIDGLISARKELELVIENLKLDKEHLNETIKGLQDEKSELTQKLENYIQENIELTDKLEKLSAEKVSSAESIEIVESLTTQEKLELEEYNKGIFVGKADEHTDENISSQNDKNIDSLIEQREELNKKIELFTQEREEVMEKMSKIKDENESLLSKIAELNEQSSILQRSIEGLSNEKNLLQNLNQDLLQQIEDLKRERIDIMKETAEIAKPTEEVSDGVPVEVQHDDKTSTDKGAKGAKTVKQLTKEILKLKNTIKEREDEIADCQMKILSLEEQQQKQSESLQTSASNENKIKSLAEENNHLKQELQNAKKDREAEHNLLQLKQSHDMLQQELQKVHQEYSISVNSRDARINELENVLLEYEKQMFNYGNSLQQKDKEISEYINQITKLNDVSQKLKSTIELLEEEKAKDQNGELVKTLNKQIAAYQKKLLENEEKLKVLEEEKMQLHIIKSELVNKNTNLEAELAILKETFSEKQIMIKELQALQQKHTEEMSAKQLETVERDEEIHEIKLQLRKESIENEKLHNSVSEKEKKINDLFKELDETKEKVIELSNEKNQSSDQFIALETKNKELLEKLKKLAISIKKKAIIHAELEANYGECQNQLTTKQEQMDQLLIQVETLPALQDKLKHADEEINRLQSQKVTIEQQRVQDLNHLHSEMKSLQEKFFLSSKEISQLTDSLNTLHKELLFSRDENEHLKAQLDSLNKKLVEHEIEQKNNMNLITKISSLEADINQKQSQISELLSKIEHLEHQQTQAQYGYDAKVQERDLFIENLEAETSKYKNRICRLEESISVMEDRRHSLERKADQLGNQLQEKQKAYTEYSSQEDELVTRLAALMDHDRILEKQLFEIENENKELQYKVHHLNEDNQKLRKSLSDMQEHYNVLLDKANKFDSAESEISKYEVQLRDLEANFKRVTHEHQSLIMKKKQEIEELEAEFNTQIENAFKEKKILSEKYEKVNEYVSQLEAKLQEYKTNIETLNLNANELSRLNQELNEKCSNKHNIVTPDYTEQYICEINRLNSIVSSKSDEIYELKNKIQSHQTNNVAVVSDFESKISEMAIRMREKHAEVEKLTLELSSLQQDNVQLHNALATKDQQIKELSDNKKLTFEMNIPKTEGMLISSTIEPLNDGNIDVSSIDSQIVSGITEPSLEKKHSTKKVQESLVKQSPSGQIEEPLISPKKAYICYTNEDDNAPVETDPFNSDEGWGLGENEEIGEVTPGFSHLNNQIEQLKKENDTLKGELQTNNIKLLKALKKLKELKATNDMLTNELKIVKQMSQSAFFDNAIEDELRLNITELEKKIEELNVELAKEKRDKESLRKQNEVFHNANDRLTEIKEKLDTEIHVWKFKFKEANDKISTLQWGGESREPTELRQSHLSTMDESKFKDELNKVEKENEELHAMVDQLNTLTQELQSRETLLQNKITSLNEQVQQHKGTCENCLLLQNQIEDLNKTKNELRKNNGLLTEKLQNVEMLYKEQLEKYHSLEAHYETMAKQLEQQKSELFHSSKFEEIQVKVKQLENDKLELLDINSALQKELAEHNETKTNSLELLEKNNKLEEVLLCQENERTELIDKINSLQEEVRKLHEHEGRNVELLDNNIKLEEKVLELNKLQSEAQSHILSLVSELENTKSKINLHKLEEINPNIQNADNFALVEKCSAMEQHLLQFQHNLEAANSNILQLQSENHELTLNSKQYLEQINELNLKIQNLNSENDNLLSTVTELRSSVSSAIDQRGFEIAELWKQHLAQRESEFEKIETDLRAELSASEVKYEQLLENVQSASQEETNKLVIMEQLNSLQKKVEDKEEHIRSLQTKYAETMNQMDIFRSEMEDERVAHENKLLEQQEEYEKMIQELTVKNYKHSETYEETFKGVQNELLMYKTKNDELNQLIEDLHRKLENLEGNVTDLTKELRTKESEIYQKTHDYTIALAERNEEFEHVRKQLIDYEKKIEELTYEKESELAVLRLKMHENETHYQSDNNKAKAEKTSLLEALNAKIIECTNLNKQIVDLNQELKTHASKAAEMEAALESQEIEIVGLKDEIMSLQSSMRTSSGKIQKHVSFASDTKLGSDNNKSDLNKDLLDAVPRAELDLALYMLHQRDVRCEELTMELTQLLEERDTLQLRLSDSLRLNEELKMKLKLGGLDVSLESSQETISELPSFTVEKEFIDIHRGQTSRSNSISDPDSEKPKLQAKLTELRSVKHSRDVRLRQDSEQRQLDLRLLQRDVANLPPEAVDQLAQAHHTLSRDSQSTPTVLLNWLRGKSTPKVVHM
ncbi:unnamed protein product [Arctia plantaginis]|uniref:Vitellogenin domain-containing protein n=1 Tax=Arctia plantaginis TaxID=874455 RepID=A0A8S1BAM9_ARCPL|nr:unnamed protein product [Arctia plantaginis]